jgi:ketosteroid isomerase-like protein
MHPNAQLLEDFYAAFARRDGAAMAACYHPEARFSDPVFPALSGAEAGAMWRMLCHNGKDLRVEHSGVSADGAHGRAHWEATYTFRATGRKVHNAIDATFEFRDGRIWRHTDAFPFWRWARQALGPTGVLLGWTPLVRGKVRRLAGRSLRDFMAQGR